MPSSLNSLLGHAPTRMALRKMNPIMVNTPRMEESIRFYRDILGLAIREQHGMHWVEFETGDTTLALHPANLAGTSDSPPRIGTIQINFQVDDIDAAFEEFKRRGAPIRAPPHELEGVPGLWYFDLFDPNGVWIGVTGRSRRSGRPTKR